LPMATKVARRISVLSRVDAQHRSMVCAPKAPTKPTSRAVARADPVARVEAAAEAEPRARREPARVPAPARVAHRVVAAVRKPAAVAAAQKPAAAETKPAAPTTTVAVGAEHREAPKATLQRGSRCSQQPQCSCVAGDRENATRVER